MQPAAYVTERGDLEWTPKAREYVPGPDIRYIDYAEGDDANSGRSPDEAWKHHPWDNAAEGRAAVERGTTYAFKRGVVYRGTLRATESGSSENPIQLTVDPEWGEGEAVISGSVRVEGPWRKADVLIAPEIPEPEKVWYVDLKKTLDPRAIWQVEGNGEVVRIPVARSPNWKPDNADDVKSGWWEWLEVGTGIPYEGMREMNRASDPEHLRNGPDLTGATVWSEWIAVMGTPHAARVERHDRETGSLYFTGFFSGSNRMEPHNRYFVEDAAALLDVPGEFFFSRKGADRGRLYMRLPGDMDPNTTQVEVANALSLVDLAGQSHLEISGLTFRFANVYDPTVRPRESPDVQSAAICNYGSGKDIVIRHCRFEHLAQAIFLKAYGDGDFIDEIEIADNAIAHTDHGAITIEDGSYFYRSLPGRGRVGNVRVLRNHLSDIGFRPERKYHGHALTIVFARTAEVAGNVLERLAGAGIFVFGGKGSNHPETVPFSRILIHHNKVTDSLLNTNDWGGIEIWQGGPAYVYNNISGNPGGYWHWKHLETLEKGQRDHTSARFGFAYYLDGAFKSYLFNNVAWGKSSDLRSPLLNSAAFQEIHGYLNSYFNNTTFRFAAGMRRQAPVAGRTLYLGNLWLDLSEMVFRHDKVQFADADANAEHVGEAHDHYAYETLAYSGNVIEEGFGSFGVFESTGLLHPALESFSTALKRRGAMQSEVGVVTGEALVLDAEVHDFRLHPQSPAIDRGVKVFVPWALSGVVGEWHFLRNEKDPARIFDEHWLMNESYLNREHYHNNPRYDLFLSSSDSEAFVEGPLEDWTEGAVHFDGKRYASLADEKLREDVTYESGDKRYEIPAARIPTVDMQENSFILELYLRPALSGEEQWLVSKADEQRGYRLVLDKAGYVRMELINGGKVICSRRSGHPVARDEWSHLLVEVDRDILDTDNRPIDVFINGEQSNGKWEGIMPTKYIQLSNRADFLVGGSGGGSGFIGEIDFLRVARGTLSDAQTSIEELYAWQFNGPHLRDFRGSPVNGKRRDAGAFELSR